MVTFSYDGSVLVGVEKVKDLAVKQKGFGSQLRVFHWHGSQLQRIDTLLLPTTGFEQLALSSDGTRAVVIGEGGSKFILVDLTARKTRIIWTHHRGTPGFRSALVAWWHGASFYLQGYLHNALDQQVFDGLVRLNLARSGPDMFEPVLDVRPLLRALRAFQFSIYVEPAQAFYGAVPKAGEVDLYVCQGGVLRPIDQVMAIGGVAAAENRILYAARYPNNKRDVILRDVTSNKVWHLGHDNLPFNYLFLSATGKTAVVTLMDFRGQSMSYFYAEEKDRFRLHPIPHLQDVRPGTLRLSGNGRVFAFYSPQGLLYGFLP
jgi:hypothetical protein